MAIISEREKRERRDQMRKKRRRKATLLCGMLFLLCLGAAGSLLYFFKWRQPQPELQYAFSMFDPVLGVRKTVFASERAVSFADPLCVESGDCNTDKVSITSGAAELFDLENKEVLYAKNIHKRMYPASLTKLMTALVAMEYGNLDDEVTVGWECEEIDPDSSVCEIDPGEVYTLRQLLYGMIIASGNDAAMTIAVHVAGSVENFVSLMNQEAQKIGATNTHFSNVHGLHEDNHYTTAYDLYLIFREALKYDVFEDMISQKTYTATYTTAEGEKMEITWNSTNQYFTGEADQPQNITVFGGKTGTTDEAGACLSLITRDEYGNSYFSLVLKADSKITLYSEMTELLSQIKK
ncbi:MAG: D-alanyl-D-alanine carboxypeptidase family protein [Lachnospiraceae bacterium]|nr:D-alanyl-D-alanine carboxypeptidase [Robinsoniella sp.]MDY3765388.1 D-alanyl-D-alanine carboxypeptidase family protein [Lachnospiraceae bacterium]